MPTICVYPGSFDPFTMGHLDVLKRACSLFDVVYAAVLKNNTKATFFSTSERMEFIERAAESEGLKNVRVDSFAGLMVDYAKRVKASHAVRGLRAISDFEYEFKISAMNRRLSPELEIIYLMTNPQYSFLSSSIVKEVASFGGAIAGLIPEVNEKTISERLLSK